MNPSHEGGVTTMKDLFEPVYSVDTWKEVIVDSEKSIELLEQGHNPMGVNVGKWIIKYKAMKVIALQKLYELEQGLQVAANTLKNEDSNDDECGQDSHAVDDEKESHEDDDEYGRQEFRAVDDDEESHEDEDECGQQGSHDNEELNGVRIPAGNVSGDVVFFNNSQAELPICQKFEITGQGVVKVATEVAREELDQGAVKMDDKEGRALASLNERIEVACKEKLDKKVLVEVEVRRDKTAQDGVDRTADYEEMLTSKEAGENEDSDKLNGRLIEVVPRAAEIKPVDEKSWGLTLHLKTIDNEAVRKEFASEEGVKRTAEVTAIQVKETFGESRVAGETAKEEDCGAIKEKIDAEELLKSPFKFGKVRTPRTSKASSELTSRSLHSVEEERVAGDMVNKYVVGEKEVFKLLSESGEAVKIRRKEKADTGKLKLEQQCGSLEQARDSAELKFSEVTYVKRCFGGIVYIAQIDKEGIRMMGEGAVVHTPNSIEFYNPREKLFGNMPQSKNCIRLNIPFDHVDNKLKLEQKLLDYAILSKGSYAKSEFIKKGVGGSNPLEQHINIVKNRIEGIGHGIAHSSGEPLFVDMPWFKGLASFKLAETGFVERFIGGCGFFARPFLITKASRLKGFDPRFQKKLEKSERTNPLFKQTDIQLKLVLQ